MSLIHKAALVAGVVTVLQSTTGIVKNFVAVRGCHNA